MVSLERSYIKKLSSIMQKHAEGHILKALVEGLQVFGFALLKEKDGFAC